MSRAVSFVALILIALAWSQNAEAARPRQEVGSLTCRLGPSVGLLVGSRQSMNCRFVGSGGRRIENYEGTTTRVGLDLGVTAGGVMVWSVLKRTRSIGRGALAGQYVGASGDISFGAGVGAKVLVGGSRRTTMLQPVSLNARVGANLAVGVTALTLRYAG